MLPESITSIGTEAFFNCNKLSNINLPASLKTIGGNAFRWCKSLPAELYLPDGISAIGSDLFRDSSCSKFHASWNSDTARAMGISGYSIIDESVNCRIKHCGTTSGSEYYGIEIQEIYDKTITSFECMENTYSIAASVFSGCSNLTSFTAPAFSYSKKNLSEIKASAFKDCVNLKSITIPNTLNTVGISAFSGCDSLKDVYINSQNGWQPSSIADGNQPLTDATVHGFCGSNMRYTLDKNGLLTISGGGDMERAPWPKRKVIRAVIENGVEKLCASAFSDSSNLTSVTIPESVTWIAEYTF